MKTMGPALIQTMTIHRRIREGTKTAMTILSIVKGMSMAVMGMQNMPMGHTEKTRPMAAMVSMAVMAAMRIIMPIW